MGKSIDIIVRAKDATASAWKSVSARAKKLSSGIRKSLGGIGRFAKKAASAVGLVGAAALAASAKAVQAYKAQAQAEAKLEAILKTTGYTAGKTATELKDQASKLQDLTGISDASIISTQGLVASFKNIRGDQFDRATMAALDMGAAMKKAGKDEAAVEANSIQVGKALNDPIKGLSILNRVGVTFTDQQKEQIKAMQEAGDMAGAQGVILGELESEFGGVAAAMGKASHGTDQLKQSFGDTIEQIGKAIVETDGFDSVISKITAGLKNLTEAGYIDLWAENIRKAIKSIAPVISKIGDAFASVKTKIQEGAAYLGARSMGSSHKEAMGIAKQTPKDLKDETEARLAAIRAEREAKKKAALEAERLAMAEAQAKRKVADAAEAAAKVEKAAAEAAKKASEEKQKTDRDAEKAAENRKQEAAKLLKIDKKLADNAADAEIREFHKAAAGNDANIAKLQAQLGNIAVTKQERRQQERQAKDEAKANRKEEQLRAAQDRGTKLNKNDAAWLKQRDLQAKIAQEQKDKAINEQNARLREQHKAEEQRKAQLDELKKTRNVLQQNLQGGI